MIGVSLIKANIEAQQQRGHSHERQKRMRRPEGSRPSASAAGRTIGGYRVFGGEPARKPDIAPNFDFDEEDRKAEERLKSYEEQIAEAEALIAAQGAKAPQILSGEIESDGGQCGVRALLNSRENLANAVILSEILQPPLSLRG